MSRIYALALTTFRDASRSRVLYGILLVVVLLNLFAIVLGEMSWNQEARVARDIGLFGIAFFGSFTAAFLGVTLLYREIQKRTIHTLVSKPLERYEVILGKYLGMCISLLLLVGLFTLSMLGLFALQDVEFTSAVAKAILLGFVQVLVVAAIAVFFSSFSTPFLSAIFTFGLFLVGRATPEMRAVIKTSESDFVQSVCNIALKVVPDLHMFMVSGGTVEGQHVSVHSDFVNWGYVLSSVGYGFLWIAILLVLASVIFSRRDFV